MTVEPFDVLQDERAEYWSETGDTLTLTDYLTLHFLSSPAPARSDAAGFPAEPAERPALDAFPLDDTGDLSSRASRATAPQTHAPPE